MELLSPAGSVEKLRIVYRYGADAAYIGLRSFSLRARAENVDPEDLAAARSLKGDRRLYCTLNTYVRQRDREELRRLVERTDWSLFDAVIVSDLGVIDTIRRSAPAVRLHLSTQANCTNADAAKRYRDIGFSRINLARELSIREIAQIRAEVSGLELEAFVHGAMCLAYSGRCLLSAWTTGRSANEGDCAQTCRWSWRVGVPAFEYGEIGESTRPGERFAVFEGDSFTSILSSKDIMMAPHLRLLRDAGVDAVKIEGRMKSVYYAALVTQAYRFAIDALDDESIDPVPHVAELHRVSRREYSTGFYFADTDVQHPAGEGYLRSGRFLGIVRHVDERGTYEIDVRNSIRVGTTIEFISPGRAARSDDAFSLYNEGGDPVVVVNHGARGYLRTDLPLEVDTVIRQIPEDSPVW